MTVDKKEFFSWAMLVVALISCIVSGWSSLSSSKSAEAASHSAATAKEALMTPYREAFYDNQINGCLTLMEALNEYYFKVQLVIDKHNRVLTDEVRAEVQQEAKDEMEHFNKMFRQMVPILPKEIYESVGNCFNVLMGAGDPVIAQRYAPQMVKPQDPIREIRNAYVAVINSYRTLLGIEPLSEDLIKKFTPETGE